MVWSLKKDFFPFNDFFQDPGVFTIEPAAEQQAHFTTQHRSFVQLFFLLGFGDELRGLYGFMGIRIEGHKCKEGVGGQFGVPAAGIAGEYLDIDFHGSIEGAGNAGFKGDDMAQGNRLAKGEMIHGQGYTIGFGMTVGTDRSRDVHPAHEVAPHGIAQGIGIVGHDHFRHDRS